MKNKALNSNITGQEFERYVVEGLRSVPEEFRRHLENIIIVTEEEPSAEQRKLMLLEGDDTLLGLYEGIPYSQRDSSYSGALPDKITLFRKPILEAASSPEEVREIVKETVWHEIAHFFGMDEDEVQNAEVARKASSKKKKIPL